MQNVIKRQWKIEQKKSEILLVMRICERNWNLIVCCCTKWRAERRGGFASLNARIKHLNSLTLWWIKIEKKNLPSRICQRETCYSDDRRIVQFQNENILLEKRSSLEDLIYHTQIIIKEGSSRINNQTLPEQNSS